MWRFKMALMFLFLFIYTILDNKKQQRDLAGRMNGGTICEIYVSFNICWWR